MNVDYLVGMANSIGGFFDAMPDREESLHGISDHIRMFWAPRMREQLVAHCQDTDNAGVMPIVAEALARYSILPAAQPLEANDPRSAEERHAWDGATES